MTKRLLAEVPAPSAWKSIGQPVAWAMIAGITIVDLFWCTTVGLRVANWQVPAAISVALSLFSAGYRRRSTKIAIMLEGAALWVAFSAAACVFTYLVATTAGTLKDFDVVKLDLAIGFDWQIWREIVLTHRFLYWPLRAAYESLPLQILLTVVVLPVIGKGSRVGDLLVLATTTLLLTVLVFALYPVVGPFGAYGEGHEPFIDHFLALRSGGPWSFDLSAMEGIIQMPSYHTVLAILFCYAFRGTGWIGWCVTGLNALMLPSIPPMGWHYLSDMIVGCAITFLCLVVVPPIMHHARYRWSGDVRRAAYEPAPG